MDERWESVLQALIFCAIGFTIFLLTKKRPGQPQSQLLEILWRNLRIGGMIVAIGSAGAAVHLLLIMWGYIEY